MLDQISQSIYGINKHEGLGDVELRDSQFLGNNIC